MAEVNYRGGGANFLGGYKDGLTMKDLMRKDQEAERLRVQEQDMRAAMKRNTSVNPDGTPNMDRVGYMRDLNHVAPDKVMEANQSFQKMDSDKIKMLLDKSQAAGQLLGGIRSQADYDQRRPMLLANGIVDEKDLPPQWDPNYIRGLEMRALTVNQRAQMENDRLNRLARGTGGPGGVGGGKPPAGYRFKPDGTLEPIPGGPAAQAAGNREAKQKQDAGLVVQDIGRSLDLIEKSPAAAGTKDFGLMSYVPGSSAQSLDHLLDSVKSNIGFNKLQAMREASPTGGALGSVSEKETAMLQATAGKLSSYMPEDQLKDNLKRLYNQYNDIVHGPGKGPPRHQLSFDEQGNPVERRIVNEPQTKTIGGVTYKKVQGGWEEIAMPASR